MLRKLRSRLTYANVVATLGLFVAVGTGGAYAANTIGSADIIDGQVKSADIGNGEVNSADVKDQSLTTFDVSTFLGADIVDGTLTGADIGDHSLKDEDIAETNSVDFQAYIGTVGARSCLTTYASGVNAQGDHLVLTPNFNDSSFRLIYAAQYHPDQEYAAIQACNPTDTATDDDWTHFNLLVINAN